jgi:hypothetical protein
MALAARAVSKAVTSCYLYAHLDNAMKTFNEWNKLFTEQRLDAFNTEDGSGIAWLKLKSMFRKEILETFLSENSLNIANDKTAFESLYKLYVNGKLQITTIDSFLVKYNKNELRDLRDNFDNIKAELYKLQSFSWGGDVSNSLDKQIVSYVKKCWNYDEICNKIEGDIADNTKRYTLNTWYNNWSTILTEYLFKSHPETISAIGKVKSVDFFIDSTPLDLKITYFPKEYLKQKRKLDNLEVEITVLKRLAKIHNVNFDKNASEEQLKYQITEQLKDLRIPEINEGLNKLLCENKAIIQKTVNNKSELIKWLYEQQGEMRFGAENRLFLILVDINNLTESWKLKRNFDLLKPQITKYLNGFNASRLVRVDFQFKNKHYESLADALFIII